MPQKSPPALRLARTHHCSQPKKRVRYICLLLVPSISRQGRFAMSRRGPLTQPRTSPNFSCRGPQLFTAKRSKFWSIGLTGVNKYQDPCYAVGLVKSRCHASSISLPAGPNSRLVLAAHAREALRQIVRYGWATDI